MLKRLINWLLEPFDADKTEPQSLLDELNEAHEKWKEALEAVNYAEGDFVDVAFANLEAAEKRYNTLIKAYTVSV